jgi:hypothetical protein
MRLFSVQQGGGSVKAFVAQISAGGDHARLRLRLQGLSETILNPHFRFESE